MFKRPDIMIKKKLWWYNTKLRNEIKEEPELFELYKVYKHIAKIFVHNNNLLCK